VHSLLIRRPLYLRSRCCMFFARHGGTQRRIFAWDGKNSSSTSGFFHRLRVCKSANEHVANLFPPRFTVPKTWRVLRRFQKLRFLVRVRSLATRFDRPAKSESCYFRTALKQLYEAVICFGKTLSEIAM